jgi:hypothetical protein
MENICITPSIQQKIDEFRREAEAQSRAKEIRRIREELVPLKTIVGEIKSFFYNLGVSQVRAKLYHGKMVRYCFLKTNKKKVHLRGEEKEAEVKIEMYLFRGYVTTSRRRPIDQITVFYLINDKIQKTMDMIYEGTRVLSERFRSWCKKEGLPSF